MKVIINQPDMTITPKIKYPSLVISITLGTIVLALREEIPNKTFTGIVLGSTRSKETGFIKGYISDQWCTTSFIPYTGEVTLSND